MTLFATIAERKDLSARLRARLKDIENDVFEVANEEVGTLADINTDLYDIERELIGHARVFHALLSSHREQRARLQADQLAQINEATEARRELGEGPMQHERI